MAEFDMISHLKDVEKRANDILSSAQSEAGTCIAKAREEAESRYQRGCEAIRSSLKARLSQEEESMKKMQCEMVESYRAEVMGLKLDIDSFNSLLDKILFN